MVFNSHKFVLTSVSIAAVIGLALPTFADSNTKELPEIQVIGKTQRDINAIPGSAAVISQKALAQSVPMTINEALRKVSGTYLRDEDGLGLRTNISIRGLNGDRSRKTLLLEDGFPLSLAPYGENAAYYSPQIERMDRIEVLKGSGSILYGPQTVGGVINFITPQAPSKLTSKASVTMGSNGYLSVRSQDGGTWRDIGITSDLLYKRGDGVRENAPFKIYDASMKLATYLDEDSDISLKFHYYNEESASTYLGLTQKMYEDNHNQFPAVNDRLFVERAGVSATHQYRGWKDIEVQTNVYAYFTKRHWWRQDYSRTSSANAVRTVGDASLVDTGNKENSGVIYFTDSNGGRNREYRVVGIAPRISWGDVKMGAKLHYELERNRRVNGGTKSSRSGLIKSDEHRSTLAGAGYGQYQQTVSPKLRINYGLRAEAFKQYREIFRANNAESNITGATKLKIEWIPGVGATYDADETTNFFAGIHRGFAPPRFSDAINSSGQDVKLDAERSWNLEAGVRTTLLDDIDTNATVFYYDYENQVVPGSASSQTESVNGGKTRHIGVELDASTTKTDVIEGWDFTPSLALTFTRATIIGNRNSSDSTPVVLATDGRSLPYSPELTATLGLGLANDCSSLFLEGVYVGSMKAYDIKKDNPDEITTGQVSGLKGNIDAHFVWNFTGRHKFNDEWAVFASVKNLLDAKYIASRNPEGIFPGVSRQFQLGVTATL